MEIKELNNENFAIYGRCADLMNPSGPHIGKAPIEFYRDMISYPFSAESVSISVTSISERPFIVDELEYHSYSGECFMALDGDCIFCVAPAGNEDIPKLDKVEAFSVKKGVAVYLAPGVWHHAPYCLKGNGHLSTLVILPERTYRNDCVLYKVEKEDKIVL